MGDRVDSDPVLAEVVGLWPALPEAIRAGIAAMVKAAAKGAGNPTQPTGMDG